MEAHVAENPELEVDTMIDADDELEADAADDSEGLMTILEMLASTTSDMLVAGETVKAVEMLRRALTVHQDVDVPGKPSLAPMVLATTRLLLCTALSKSGCHDLALREARLAIETMDEVWRGLLLGADPTISFRKVFSDPPQWLVRAVELSIQARQSVAVELEFTVYSTVDESLDVSAVSEEVALLQHQALQLAQQLLVQGHPARACAEQAWDNWQRREAEKDRGKAPAAYVFQRPRTPHIADMLAGRGGVPATSVGQELAEGMDEHRAWQPLQPIGGLLAPEREQEIKTFERMHRGLPPSAGRRLQRQSPSAASAPDLRLRRRDEASPSTAMTNSSDTSWDNSPTGRKAKNHIAQSPNASIRRNPIGVEMYGPGGKAAWALRMSSGDPRPNKNAGPVKVADPFADWKKQSSGPTKSLGAQVLESEGTMKIYHSDLKDKSDKFKNFWMREEVGPDDLYEDRTYYCLEGMRVRNKREQKYGSPEKSPKKSPKSKGKPLTDLFKDYGVKCKSEPNLKHLSGLLEKSHAALQKEPAKPRPSKYEGMSLFQK